jgi:prepilin signal peptidase PulO-like enzyme (type II secretory pathway)
MILYRKLLAELLGTALLLAIVIGSGIMAERLSGGNIAVALLANTAATVGGLYILIEVFGPISGAHFNPAVSAVMTFRGDLSQIELATYVIVQLVGAMLGAWLGWQYLSLIILLSSLAGVFIGMTLISLNKQKRETPIPFGPYLAIAGWLALLWGKELNSWYFG